MSDWLSAGQITQTQYAQLQELVINLTGDEDREDCHLCDRETTRRGRFGTFSAPELPMCWRCAVHAREAGGQQIWWR